MVVAHPRRYPVINPGQSERMAEAVIRTEMNPYRSLNMPDGKATDGRNTPEPVLVGRKMVLSEGGKGRYLHKMVSLNQGIKGKTQLIDRRQQ